MPRARYLERIAAADLGQISRDPELLSFALAGGQAAFADNCAPCHGLGGAGQGSYPTLADDVWIWGGTLDDIHTTILHGIRSDDPDTRFNEMPRVRRLPVARRDRCGRRARPRALGPQRRPRPRRRRGATIFAEQCATCHGEAGEGLAELGGPRLNGPIWLYGGDQADIVAQITRPRHGVMPAWGGRLDPETLKILAVYVHSLGGGQ